MQWKKHLLNGYGAAFLGGSRGGGSDVSVDMISLVIIPITACLAQNISQAGTSGTICHAPDL